MGGIDYSEPLIAKAAELMPDMEFAADDDILGFAVRRRACGRVVAGVEHAAREGEGHRPRRELERDARDVGGVV